MMRIIAPIDPSTIARVDWTGGRLELDAVVDDGVEEDDVKVGGVEDGAEVIVADSEIDQLSELGSAGTK